MQRPSAAPPIDLRRPRDLGALLGATFSLYGRYFPVFASIAFAVVIPLNLVLYGGLARYFTSYDSGTWEAFVADLGSMLIAMPLITAMHVVAVMDIGEGRRPTVRRSLSAAFGVFTALLLTLLLMWMLTFLGVVALVIPGIYLYVRWYVTPQVVVVERLRGWAALQRSAELVKSMWWRVFGISIVIGILAGIAAAILYVPGQLYAEANDSGIAALAGGIFGDAITYSFQALTGTLLFFDLRARKEYAAGEWGGLAALPPSGYPPPPGGYQPPPPGYHPPGGAPPAPAPPGPEAPL